MKTTETRERTVVKIIPTNNTCREYHFLNHVHTGSCVGEQTHQMPEQELHPIAALIFERCQFINSLLIKGTSILVFRSLAATWEMIDRCLDECWMILGYTPIPIQSASPDSDQEVRHD